MSTKSNDQGRAYEYIFLCTLQSAISTFRSAQIDQNSSFFAAQHAWNTLEKIDQEKYKISAKAAVAYIFQLEPRITEDGGDLLELYIQPDKAGQEGDVRDIIIVRRNITWEIGLSLKHNHFAVKHSRLSPTIDFGDKWFGVPCSQMYWEAIKPIFTYLSDEAEKHTKFKDVPGKDTNVYRPIIQAFIDEIKRQYATHPEVPTKMVEYLLGEYDFYKVISYDAKHITEIQSYNTHGTLNQSADKIRPTIHVPLVMLPTRIISLGFVPHKNNTAELYLDGGWSFTFRIHNAETYVKPSLKFDVQILGVPITIITINCPWNL